MEPLKMLIADGAEEFRLPLAEACRGKYIVRTCRDGYEALELLRSFDPDVLVLDLMLSGLDGISLLHMAAEAGIRPVVLATSRFVSDYVIESMDHLGVGYLMIRPGNIPAVMDRLADLTQRLKAPVLTHPDVRSSLSNLLISLSVPTKLRGYNCLREAIVDMAKDPGMSITKELYPRVAAACDGTAQQVERAIRGAIQAAWSNRDEQVWREFFLPGKDGTIPRPTNAAFISRLAEYLTQDRQTQEEQMTIEEF